MLHLTSQRTQMTTAGQRRGTFFVRLLGTAFLVPFFVLVLTLASAIAFPAPALAHVMEPTQRVQQSPHSYRPDPCLASSFWSQYWLDGPNTARFHFGVINRCGFPTKNGAASYTLLQEGCDGIGTGNKTGSFAIPDLQPNQDETTTLSWNSYCIECSNGNIVGYPSFIVDVTINQVRAFDANNGLQVAIMQNSVPPEDTTILQNNANNPGPLHC